MLKSEAPKCLGAFLASGALAVSLLPCTFQAQALATETGNASVSDASLSELTEEQEHAETQLLALALIYWDNKSDVNKFSAEQKADVLKCAEILGSNYFASEDLEEKTQKDAEGAGNLFAKMYIDVLKDSLKTTQSNLSKTEKSLEEAKKTIADAEKRASSAEKTTLKYLKISKLVATPGMGKATLKWAVSDSVSGVSYRVEYRIDGSSSWKKKTVSALKATLSLKAGKKYQFRVCGVSGKSLSDYSNVATATTLPKYKKGTFKVKSTGGVVVRSKAAVSGSNLSVLKNGAKVKITKFKSSSDGSVWGKLKKKYGGKVGYVRMDNMKKA